MLETMQLTSWTEHGDLRCRTVCKKHLWRHTRVLDGALTLKGLVPRVRRRLDNGG